MEEKTFYLTHDEEQINSVLKYNFKIGDFVTILYNGNRKCIFQLGGIKCLTGEIRGRIKTTYALNANGKLCLNTEFGLLDCHIRMARPEEIIELMTKVEEINTNVNISHKRIECNLSPKSFKAGDIVTVYFPLGRCIVMLSDTPTEDGDDSLPCIYGLTSVDKLLVNTPFGYYANDELYSISYANDEEIEELLDAIAAATHKEKKVNTTITIVEEEVWG